ncbi:MAG: ribonuclease P protein component 4 [Thermoplasmata archaeon]|jgi:ribonuclease P protein subunit RPR2
MVRIARDRVSDLFGLAEKEASNGHCELADRYVALARRIGMRYNVRLLTEYRELYCRGCSTFWVEGRTVRTRIRGGRRVRTCLHCGRERRTILRPHSSAPAAPGWEGPNAVHREDGVLAGPPSDEEIEDLSEEETEEP